MGTTTKYNKKTPTPTRSYFTLSPATHISYQRNNDNSFNTTHDDDDDPTNCDSCYGFKIYFCTKNQIISQRYYFHQRQDKTHSLLYIICFISTNKVSVHTHPSSGQ